MIDRNLDQFTRAYIEAMLWSTNDESDKSGGYPMENNYGIDDFSEEFLAETIADCTKFQLENKEDISNAYLGSYNPVEYAGHDFWLTRVGHGCGFWDGDWEDDAGERLTEASKVFGEVEPYIGDDGKIYG